MSGIFQRQLQSSGEHARALTRLIPPSTRLFFFFEFQSSMYCFLFPETLAENLKQAMKDEPPRTIDRCLSRMESSLTDTISALMQSHSPTSRRIDILRKVMYFAKFFAQPQK